MTVLLRPEVRKFADEMEKELRRHDPVKGDSWKTMDEVLLDDMLEEVFEKLETIHPSNKEQRRAQLVDLANVAMMNWHILGE